MSYKINLQMQFLDQLQQEQKPITVIMANGYQMRGRIVAHDQYTILLDVDGQQQLVFNSAVSTVKEAQT